MAMTVKEFVRARARMCTTERCLKCPLYAVMKECHKIECTNVDLDSPDEVITIVEKWAAEHPEPHRKTYAEDFFEKFPNAPKNYHGVPKVGWCEVYGVGECKHLSKHCEDCWDEPMPEEVKP